jgi:hypothetical protein
MNEREVEKLLAELNSQIEPADEAELRIMARAAAGANRAAARAGSPRLRSGLAVAAALLVGSGFGFGVSGWKTPEGSAGTKVVGLGFLPAKGWTVVQSEGTGPTVATAIAANVPLNPSDVPGSPPRATVAALSHGGVVVTGTFTVRGDPHNDAFFPVRQLPLRFASAGKVAGFEDPLASPRRISRYRLRAGVGAYNVDAWIYFGGAPAVGTIGAAQRQLNRLLVASERITIATRDRVLRKNQPYVTLFGSVESRQADEPVMVEGKECGRHAPFFRQWMAVRTRPGGGWSTEAFVRTTTMFRAKWADAVSAVVTVQARASVVLQPTASRHEFEVRAGGVANFWRKRAEIQRYDRRIGTWIKLRSVVLTDNTYGGSASATFTLRVPKGTLLRAFFPLSQARPCYLAGYSNLIHA